MELGRRQIVLGIVVAALIGAGLAWWSRPNPTPPSPVRTSPETAAPDASERRIYKWQDQSGVWNFTDRPPADRPYTEVSETPNVTVLPSVIPEAADTDRGPAASTPPN